MPPEIRIPGLPPLRTEDLGRGLIFVLSILMVLFGFGDGKLSNLSSEQNPSNPVVVVSPSKPGKDLTDSQITAELTQRMSNDVRDNGAPQFPDDGLAADAQRIADRAAKDNRLPSNTDTTTTFFVKKEKKPTVSDLYSSLQGTTAYKHYGEAIDFGIGVAHNASGTFVTLRVQLNAQSV